MRLEHKQRLKKLVTLFRPRYLLVEKNGHIRQYKIPVIPIALCAFCLSSFYLYQQFADRDKLTLAEQYSHYHASDIHQIQMENRKLKYQLDILQTFMDSLDKEQSIDDNKTKNKKEKFFSFFTRQNENKDISKYSFIDIPKNYLKDIEFHKNLLEQKWKLITQKNKNKNHIDSVEESQKILTSYVSKQIKKEVEQIKFMISETGVDVKKVSELANTEFKNQGGPFVALAKESIYYEEIDKELLAFQSLVKEYQLFNKLLPSIPMAVPLDEYRYTSFYGVRRDPINHKLSHHHGIDMVSKHGAEIYSTAPGKVTFAGRKSGYGKVVEVDHGHGFITRYGHLHKMAVQKGQDVKYREKIGFLGNTGRSTGSHLHYEIRFNNKPLDPLKFIKAGYHVFKK